MSTSLQIEAGPGDHTVETYTFEHAPFEPKTFKDMQLKDCWIKWGLAHRTVSQFRIGGKRFNTDEIDAFFLDFFNSGDVRQHFSAQDKRGNPVSLGGKATEVKFEALICTATSMEMFDVFVQSGVIANIEDDAEGSDDAEEAQVAIQKGGYVRRKMDEQIEGVTVGDLLKDSLLNEYADHPVDSLIEPEGGQKELLFRLFKWIVVGGGSCQPDEYWGAYLECTKGLYRDLTTVTKEGTSGALHVVSKAYSIRALKTEGGRELTLFPTDSPHNVLVVVVDPLKRLVTVLYSAFIPFW